MNMIALNKLCKKGVSSLRQKDVVNDGPYPVYGASGVVGYSADYQNEERYVAVIKDGAGVGRACVCEPKSSVLGTMQALLPAEGVDCDYLLHLVRSMKLGDGFSGSTIPHIYFKDYGKRLLVEHSSSEQRQIAKSLYAVESEIAALSMQLERFDDLVKSRFVEMFGNEETEWETIPLGDLCTVVRGGSPRPISNYLGGDVPWIKIGDASKNDSVYLHYTKEFITRAGIKKSRLLKPGSLIFANSGVSLGFARIITFEGCIHDGWLALQDIDERLDKVFLLLSLNQMTDEFRLKAPAGTQPNLNTDIMKRYAQIIPPIEIQREYVAFAQQVDKLKFETQQAIDKLQMLYDSLAQEYFGNE